MGRAPDGRKPPGGLGRLPRSVLADGFDVLRDNPTAPRKQAALLRRPGPDERAGAGRRARFARAAVFEEFEYKHGRAIDYRDFVDRGPNQTPRSWGAPR